MKVSDQDQNPDQNPDQDSKVDEEVAKVPENKDLGLFNIPNPYEELLKDQQALKVFDRHVVLPALRNLFFTSDIAEARYPGVFWKTDKQPTTAAEWLGLFCQWLFGKPFFMYKEAEVSDEDLKEQVDVEDQDLKEDVEVLKKKGRLYHTMFFVPDGYHWQENEWLQPGVIDKWWASHGKKQSPDHRLAVLKWSFERMPFEEVAKCIGVHMLLPFDGFLQVIIRALTGSPHPCYGPEHPQNQDAAAKKQAFRALCDKHKNPDVPVPASLLRLGLRDIPMYDEDKTDDPIWNQLFRFFSAWTTPWMYRKERWVMHSARESIMRLNWTLTAPSDSTSKIGRGMGGLVPFPCVMQQDACCAKVANQTIATSPIGTVERLARLTEPELLSGGVSVDVCECEVCRRYESSSS